MQDTGKNDFSKTLTKTDLQDFFKKKDKKPKQIIKDPINKNKDNIAIVKEKKLIKEFLSTAKERNQLGEVNAKFKNNGINAYDYIKNKGKNTFGIIQEEHSEEECSENNEGIESSESNEEINEVDFIGDKVGEPENNTSNKSYSNSMEQSENIKELNGASLTFGGTANKLSNSIVHDKTKKESEVPARVIQKNMVKKNVPVVLLKMQYETKQERYSKNKDPQNILFNGTLGKNNKQKEKLGKDLNKYVNYASDIDKRNISWYYKRIDARKGFNRFVKDIYAHEKYYGKPIKYFLNNTKIKHDEKMEQISEIVHYGTNKTIIDETLFPGLSKQLEEYNENKLKKERNKTEPENDNKTLITTIDKKPTTNIKQTTEQHTNNKLPPKKQSDSLYAKIEKLVKKRFQEEQTFYSRIQKEKREKEKFMKSTFYKNKEKAEQAYYNNKLHIKHILNKKQKEAKQKRNLMNNYAKNIYEKVRIREGQTLTKWRKNIGLKTKIQNKENNNNKSKINGRSKKVKVGRKK